MYCIKCGTKLPDGSVFCRVCGNKQNSIDLSGGNTQLVPGKCTNCGGILKIDSSKEAAICPFCGQPYIVSKAINNINLNGVTNIDVANIKIEGLPTAENYKERARNFEREGDVESAMSYYNKALDLSPNDKTLTDSVKRLHTYPFFSSECTYHYKRGKLFLIKDKIVYTRKQTQKVIPFDNIFKVYSAGFASNRELNIETDLISNFDALSGMNRKVFVFRFGKKELVKKWESVIKNALNGKYPPQIK